MKEKNLDGFYIRKNMERMIAYDENLKRHYLHIMNCYRDVEPIRKLAVICNDKNIYTDIWYGKGSKDSLYIIITSDIDKYQVRAKAPTLVNTIDLFRDLTKIFGLKIFEIVVPMYIYKINPEDKEFRQIVIDILIDR